MSVYKLKSVALLVWDIIIDLFTECEDDSYAWWSWIITLTLISWGAWCKSQGTNDSLSIWTPVQVTLSSIPVGWIFGYRFGCCIFDAFWDREV